MGSLVCHQRLCVGWCLAKLAHSPSAAEYLWAGGRSSQRAPHISGALSLAVRHSRLPTRHHGGRQPLQKLEATVRPDVC